MKKHGKILNFLVDNLGACQLSYALTKKANELCSKDKCSVVVFYEQISPYHLQPYFPTMQMLEHISQKGISISTSIDTTFKLMGSFGAERRLYYVWDWPFIVNLPIYEKIINLLIDPKLEIIARCESHAKIIENFCNRKVNFIFDNFDRIEEFIC